MKKKKKKRVVFIIIIFLVDLVCIMAACGHDTFFLKRRERKPFVLLFPLSPLQPEHFFLFFS